MEDEDFVPRGQNDAAGVEGDYDPQAAEPSVAAKQDVEAAAPKPRRQYTPRAATAKPVAPTPAQAAPTQQASAPRATTQRGFGNRTQYGAGK
jgi:hypothetical protein